MSDPGALRLTSSNRFAVADRVRAVLALCVEDNLTTAARRLKVSESTLRIALDPNWPQQTLDILVAVVEQCGIDPSFLLTGEYNASTHRAALENDRAFVERLLIRIAAGASALPVIMVSAAKQR